MNIIYIYIGTVLLLLSKTVHADSAEIIAGGIFGVVGAIYLVMFWLLFKFLRFLYKKFFK